MFNSGSLNEQVNEKVAYDFQDEKKGTVLIGILEDPVRDTSGQI
jgi:hypothetical protein